MAISSGFLCFLLEYRLLLLSGLVLSCVSSCGLDGFVASVVESFELPQYYPRSLRPFGSKAGLIYEAIL